MSVTFCECCAKGGADTRTTRVGGKLYKAELCQACVNEKHARVSCVLCKELTWYCQRELHARLDHSRALEMLEKEEKLPLPAPTLYSIGKLPIFGPRQHP